VLVKTYPRVVEDSLVGFLCDFIKEAIDSLREELLFFLVLDNVSLMEGASWALLEAVTQTCDNLIIVICIQSNPFAALDQD
jgi:hypothetical protein